MTDPSAPQAKSKLTIECTGFHSIGRGSLRGFATVVVKELRLQIHDVAIHERDGGRWAQLPGKPQLRDGELVRDGQGKPQYLRVLEFTDSATGRAFSKRVIEALEAFEPDAFGDEEAAA
jgi:hypothetical protein